MDFGTLLTGIAIGIALTFGLQAWFDRPQPRTPSKPIGAQWTPEAAETLVRGWFK